MLDDKLWVFNAAIFINVKTKCKLHVAAVRRTRLVERNRIHDLATTCRTHPEFEVVLTNNALLNDRKIAAPGRLRETRTPGTCIPQRTRKPEIDRIARQLTVRDDGTAEIGMRIKPLPSAPQRPA